MRRLLFEALLVAALVLAIVMAAAEHQVAEKNYEAVETLVEISDQQQKAIEAQQEALDRGKAIVYRLAHQIAQDGTVACDQREF